MTTTEYFYYFIEIFLFLTLNLAFMCPSYLVIRKMVNIKQVQWKRHTIAIGITLLNIIIAELLMIAFLAYLEVKIDTYQFDVLGAFVIFFNLPYLLLIGVISTMRASLINSKQQNATIKS